MIPSLPILLSVAVMNAIPYLPWRGPADSALAISGTADSREGPMAVCPRVHAVATGVMTRRQDGTPMSEILSLALMDMDPESSGFRTIERIVYAAFERPQFNTPEVQARVIEEFANDQEAACFMAFRALIESPR